MDIDPGTADTNIDLTALLGSRICHDLISPLGAIANGVELLMMAGTMAGPEVALIAESVAAANARIRFFRVAFGIASADQRIGRAEVMGILGDMTRGARLRIEWHGPPDAPRGAVKLAFLGLSCLETALPWGGQVTVHALGDAWTITARAEKIKIDDRLWARLGKGAATSALTPAQIQFALMPDEVRRQGRLLALQIAPDLITITF